MKNLDYLWEHTLNGWAWQVKDEFLGLLELMLKHGTKSVLEIGTHLGGSAVGFLSIGCHVTSVDIERQPRLTKIEKLFPHKFFFLYRQEVGNTFQPGEFDMLYIDGNHSYAECRKDFDEFAPCVKPGGLIVFHDILKNELHAKQDCEVWRVIEEVKNDTYVEIVTDGTWGGIGVLVV